MRRPAAPALLAAALSALLLAGCASTQPPGPSATAAAPAASSCSIGQLGDGEQMAFRAAALGGARCLVGEIVTVD